MNLTDHFTSSELDVATESQYNIGKARILCAELLEPIHTKWGKLRVTCGYRSPQHNASVGGKSNSFHLYEDGKCAADFEPMEGIVTDVFDWIRLESGLNFDKVILESSHCIATVIHIQLDINNAPRRLAYRGSTGNGLVYTPEEVR